MWTASCARSWTVCRPPPRSLREAYQSPFHDAGRRRGEGVDLVVGDGGVVRGILGAVLDVLHKFAAPTGERGSILLMSGGLIVLGFLFLAFLFRSAIVGDLAPVANARAPTPRVLLPAAGRPRVQPAAIPPRPFESGREAGREAGPVLDRALETLAARGVDARIILTRANVKRVRLYACASCALGATRGGCEFERGLLAGAFESLTGELAKVHELSCAARGDAYCEFEVRHAPLLEVLA